MEIPPDATQSAVVVVVPQAEHLVGEHRARLDLAAGWGVPAHITVLYPFVPPDRLDEQTVTRLAGAVASVPRFTAELTDVRWFGDTCVWLAPEPDESFRALITAVSTAFPEHRPYDGQHDDVVPHLTLGHVGTVEELRAAEADVASRLPVAFEVTSASVLCGTDRAGSWTTVATVPLG